MKVYEAKVVYQATDIDAPELVNSPEAVVKYVVDTFEESPMVEHIILVMLNRKNRPIGRMKVTTGTATASLVSPKDVLRPIVLSGATAAVLVHNHPSGDPSPSQADMNVTRKMKEAFRTMDVDFLDHVIVGQRDCDPHGQGYYSFSEAGLL